MPGCRLQLGTHQTPKVRHVVLMARIRSAGFDHRCSSVSTGFQITVYSNRILVIATQSGTLGNVLTIRCSCCFADIIFLVVLMYLSVSKVKTKLPYRTGGGLSEDGIIDTTSVLGSRDHPAVLACAKGLAVELSKQGESRCKSSPSRFHKL